MDFEAIGRGAYGLDLSGSGQGQLASSCKCDNKLSGSTQAENFLTSLEPVGFSRVVLHAVSNLSTWSYFRTARKRRTIRQKFRSLKIQQLTILTIKTLYFLFLYESFKCYCPLSWPLNKQGATFLLHTNVECHLFLLLTDFTTSDDWTDRRQNSSLGFLSHMKLTGLFYR